MKGNVKKGFGYLVAGFVLLFVARLGYGYLSPNERADLLGGGLRESILTTIGGRGEGFLKGNFASEKLKVQRGDAQEFSVDQKYEKIASVESTSKAFEEDESSIRGLVTKYSALIQFEQSSGLPGSRRVDLAIGVPPDRFDPMVIDLKGIGKLSTIRIDKNDKTNEYRELKAKRTSLEKARDALVALKSKGGRIDEFTNLENRILEIEQEIQTTGVSLGNYDEQNEFCTVRLSLAEQGAAAVAAISFRHRAIVALAWTIKYYVLLLGFFAFGALLTLLVVVILQRLSIIPPPVGRLAQAG